MPNMGKYKCGIANQTLVMRTQPRRLPADARASQAAPAPGARGPLWPAPIAHICARLPRSTGKPMTVPNGGSRSG
jgi:hypothetical protein